MDLIFTLNASHFFCMWVIVVIAVIYDWNIGKQATDNSTRPRLATLAFIYKKLVQWKANVNYKHKPVCEKFTQLFISK